MSAQTTINRPAQGTHNGLLGAAIVAVSAAIAGLALAASMLGSTPKAPTTQPAPAFNAPAFRAEEHHLLAAPAFDANSFRAEERRPLAIGAPAPQHAPFSWNR
jgi:hypothetical protein